MFVNFGDQFVEVSRGYDNAALVLITGPLLAHA
jgi:hypothetical protein